MHEDLHPLRGASPVHCGGPSLDCRFRDGDHYHLAKLFPHTWTYQVKWQHRVPSMSGMQALRLARPALTFEAETCWYTLHAIRGETFHPPWERCVQGGWTPMGPVARPRVDAPDPRGERVPGYDGMTSSSNA